MSFLISIVDNDSLPPDNAEAWARLAVLRAAETYPCTDKAPALTRLVERITRQFPCITKLADDDLHRGVWVDGPIENNIGHKTLTLGILHQHVPDVMMEVAEIAEALNLAIFVHTTGEVVRPMP